MIRHLKKLGRQLLYGGGRKLRAYEEQVVQAVLAALAPEDRDTLSRQLDDRERVQRWNAGRMVVFGFEDRNRVPKLPVLDENYCLAQVTLKGEKASITAAVMTHRGVLSSIEFSKAPAAIELRHLNPANLRADDRTLATLYGLSKLECLRLAKWWDPAGVEELRRRNPTL